MATFTLAIMADYGARHGKGKEVEAILEAALRRGMDVHGIVRCTGSKRLKNTLTKANILGPIPYRALGAWERVVPRFRSRLYQDRLFDLAVSQRIRRGGKVFFGVPRMPRSFRRAKEYGQITALHGVELHPAYNRTVLRALYASSNGYPSIWDQDYLGDSQATLDHVDYVFCHSAFSKQTYVDNGFAEDRVFVFPMGHDEVVGPRSAGPTRDAGMTRLLYVGNITRMKGCHLLLKVFNDLDPGRFELHLCGRVQRDMEREAAASVASRNVFLHGHTNPSRWYAHCDIFVFPSFSDSFAKVVLEAASHAMPIICTEPAQAGVVEHDVSGKLVEPTCRALDIAIRQLVGSPALCTELGANALARAKALSWPRFGEATVDHLLEISAS